MTAEEYTKVLAGLGEILATVVNGEPFADLIEPFFKLVPPLSVMLQEGRDPTDAERTALVDFRHKLSAVLQNIPTGQ